MLTFKEFLNESSTKKFRYGIFVKKDGDNHNVDGSDDYEEAKEKAADASEEHGTSFIIDNDGPSHVGTYNDGKPQRNS